MKTAPTTTDQTGTLARAAADPVVVDGAQGEGGGQVLRTALALSLAIGRPFEITRIRAGRERAGLLRQHIAAVRAACAVGDAEVEGDVLGADTLRFAPRTVRPGEYRFAVGSAGSAVLVLQAVLPALLTASGPSRLTLEGGTHNPSAPPFEFLDRTLVPALRRLGPGFSTRLERRGFYPAGGGLFALEIDPVRMLRRLDLLDAGAPVGRRAVAVVSNLPRHIAERELAELRTKVDLADDEATVVEENDGRGPGNVLLLEIETEHGVEIITGVGRYGRTAEGVARDVAAEARRYLKAGAPVGHHLADQLVVPFALAGSGSFRTGPLSRHAATAIEVTRLFLDVPIQVTREDDGVWRVSFGHASQDAPPPARRSS